MRVRWGFVAWLPVRWKCMHKCVSPGWMWIANWCHRVSTWPEKQCRRVSDDSVAGWVCRQVTCRRVSCRRVGLSPRWLAIEQCICRGQRSLTVNTCLFMIESTYLMNHEGFRNQNYFFNLGLLVGCMLVGWVGRFCRCVVYSSTRQPGDIPTRRQYFSPHQSRRHLFLPVYKHWQPGNTPLAARRQSTGSSATPHWQPGDMFHIFQQP